MVLAGGCLLFLASSFSSPEVVMAAGFILVMAGLYRFSRRSTPSGDQHNSEQDDEIQSG